MADTRLPYPCAIMLGSEGQGLPNIAIRTSVAEQPSPADSVTLHAGTRWFLHYRKTHAAGEIQRFIAPVAARWERGRNALRDRYMLSL